MEVSFIIFLWGDLVTCTVHYPQSFFKIVIFDDFTLNLGISRGLLYNNWVTWLWRGLPKLVANYNKTLTLKEYLSAFPFSDIRPMQRQVLQEICDAFNSGYKVIGTGSSNWLWQKSSCYVHSLNLGFKLYM